MVTHLPLEQVTQGSTPCSPAIRLVAVRLSSLLLAHGHGQFRVECPERTK